MSLDKMIEHLTYNPMENLYGLVGVGQDTAKKIIAALRAGQAMRDALEKAVDALTEMRETYYLAQDLYKPCVVWDATTKEGV